MYGNVTDESRKFKQSASSRDSSKTSRTNGIYLSKRITVKYRVPEYSIKLFTVWNTERLFQKYECRVHVTTNESSSGFRIIEIYGIQKNIARVKEYIDEMFITVDIPIPENKFGRIMGKEGKTFEKIKKWSDCHIQFGKRNQTNMFDSVRLSGSLKSVEYTRKLFSEILSPKEEAPRDAFKTGNKEVISLRVKIPKVSCGAIIGTGAKHLRKLADETDTIIQFQPDANSKDESLATVIGEMSNVYKVTQFIKTNSEAANKKNKNLVYVEDILNNTYKDKPETLETQEFKRQIDKSQDLVPGKIDSSNTQSIWTGSQQKVQANMASQQPMCGDPPQNILSPIQLKVVENSIQQKSLAAESQFQSAIQPLKVTPIINGQDEHAQNLSHGEVGSSSTPSNLVDSQLKALANIASQQTMWTGPALAQNSLTPIQPQLMINPMEIMYQQSLVNELLQIQTAIQPLPLQYASFTPPIPFNLIPINSNPNASFFAPPAYLPPQQLLLAPTELTLQGGYDLQTAAFLGLQSGFYI